MAKNTAPKLSEEEQKEADEKAKAAAAFARESMEQAFRDRDELSRALPRDQKALDAKDAEIQAMVMEYTHAEEFSPETEPVLCVLSRHAATRNAFAVRLLLQPRVSLKLYQVPEHEKKKLPDEKLGIQGINLILPRGKRYQVPQSVSDILDSSEIG